MTNQDNIIRVDTTTTYTTLDECLTALGIDPEKLEEATIEDDYASNAPCDFSGYCAGASCPHYFECVLGN